MLSIVVPCHNEAENIPLLVNSFLAVRPSRGEAKQLMSRQSGATSHKKCEFELIIVNNASTDNTKQVLEELLKDKKYSFAKLVSEPVPGYGKAIITGLKHARGDVLAWTHADMQTDPFDVIRGFEIFQARGDQDNIVIKGKRIKRDFPSWLFTFGMSLIASFSLKGVYNDVNGQPKIFSKKFFEKNMKDPPADFSLDLYLLAVAKKNGFKIVTFPVSFGKRMHGQSKWAFDFKSKWRTILRTVKYIFQLRGKLKN